MIASLVYFLCALFSVGCAWLLLRSYRKGKSALLLWCSVCFGALAVNNVLLFVDLVIIPSGPDLFLVRTSVGFIGFAALLYGLVWETV